MSAITTIQGFTMRNGLRVVLSVIALVLPVGLIGCGNGSAPDNAADRRYVAAATASRLDAATRAVLYRNVTEVLPNVRFSVDGGPAKPVADEVITGSIEDVAPGRGFAVIGDDQVDGTEVAFDDSRAVWRTIELTVRVTKSFSPSAPQMLKVGFVINGDTDFTRAANGLKSMGDVLLVLVRNNPVFAYDPSLYAILDDGTWLVRIDGSGNLTMPFVSADLSRGLLGSANSLSALEAHSHQPPRTIRGHTDGVLFVRDA